MKVQSREFRSQPMCAPGRAVEEAVTNSGGGIRLATRTTLLILVLVVLSISTGAQTDFNANPSLGLPNSGYGAAPSNFERLNLFSGHVDFVYPVLPVLGRGGAKYTMTLVIDNQVSVEGSVSYWARVLQRELTNPRYGPGSLTVARSTGVGELCIYPPPNSDQFYIDSYRSTVLNLALPDGSVIVLRDALYDGNMLPPSGCNNHPPSLRGKIFTSKNGSAITFTSDSDIYDNDQIIALPLSGPTGDLWFSDGTKYRIDKGRIMSIRDRQGNTLSFTYESYSYPYPYQFPGTSITSEAWRLKTARDSLDRQVTIAYDVQAGGSFGTCDEITYTDFGGTTTQTIRISKANLESVFRDSGTVPQTYQQLFPGMPQGFGASYVPGTLNPKVVSAIWFPNGKGYQFRYDVYGDLTRVVTPGGAAIEYDWAAGMTGLPVQGSASWADSYRRVIQRRTYPDGTTLEGKTTFTRPEQATLRTPQNFPSYYVYGSTVGYVDVDHLDPVNNDKVLWRERHHYYGHAASGGITLRFAPYKQGKELDVEVFGENAAPLLRRVTYEWRQRAPVTWWQTTQFITTDDQPENDPRMVETVTTLADANLVTKQSSINPSNQSVAFDQYNNQTDLWEYEFGPGTPGALVRHTHTDFVNDTNYTSLPTSGSAYLLRLPRTVSLYAVNSNGAESLIANTEFTYDQPQYLASPYGSVPGWTDPGAVPRGNATSITRWVNFDGTAFSVFPLGSYITIHAKYDQCGNVVSAWDGKGNESQIAYSSTYAFALPTSTTSADPDGAGPLTSLVSSTEYDLSTGLVTATYDANNVKTTLAYGDTLRRVTQVIRAANDAAVKAQTTYSYDDDALTVTMTSDLNTYDDNLLKRITLFDGFGRPKEARTYETSGTYITTKQEYDALGRVKRAYNPYRTTNDETYGWAVPTYDALSRVKKSETFDRNGSSTGAVTSEPIGNLTLVTDQGGVQRLSKSDFQGQLTDVWEIRPSDSLTVNVQFGQQSLTGYLTHYDYDGLGDLTAVTQSNQTRSFEYDSLGRLVFARNPEMRNDQSVMVPTAYKYDENGNLSNRVDARGVQTTIGYDKLNRLASRTYFDGTPGVTYTYGSDQTVKSNGRLISVSSSVSSYVYGQFDALGRARSSTQTTDGQVYTMAYGYNLAGELTSQTYPSGRTVNTDVDYLGRIAGVRNGPAYYAGADPTDVTNRLQYSASGALQAVKLGNGLWEHTSFNSRLQPTQVGLGTSSTDSSKLQLDYSYNTTGQSNNNGNVRAHTLTVAGMSQPFVQSYTYDPLNRLRSAEETAGGARQWIQSFGYDRFGNRSIDNSNDPNGQPKTTPALTGENPQVSDVTNRIIQRPNTSEQYNFDYAGNMTRDRNGNQFSYDAENRQTSYTLPGSQTSLAFYSYDGDGRRVKKTVGTTATVFVYNIGGQLVAEYSNAAPVNSGLNYITTDLLSSPKVITDSNSVVLERHDYLPYGDSLDGYGTRGGNPEYGGSRNRQEFTGHEKDEETGLNFAQARQYSGSQGRFTSPDQLIASASFGNPQSWNRYSYCGNDPINYVDPSGFDWYRDITQTGIISPVWLNNDPGKNSQYVPWTEFSYWNVVDQTWWWLNPHKFEQGPASSELESLSRIGKAQMAYDDANSTYVPSPLFDGFPAEMSRYVTAHTQVMTVEITIISLFTGPVSGGAGLTSLGLGRGGAVALDTNALIPLLEGTAAESGAATKAIAGQTPIVSRQAAKEFLRGGGDVNALRSFLQSNGGNIGRAPTPATIQNLLNLGVKPGDARIVGSAAERGIQLLTRDKELLTKVPGTATKF